MVVITDATYPSHPVLLVDDEPAWLRIFALTLRSVGISNTKPCSESRNVLSLLRTQEFSAVVLDLNMPGLNGEELLPLIRSECPGTPVIVITGVNDVDTAVRCLKLGAFDYYVKTAESSRLVAGLRRVLELRELQIENARLRDCFLSDELSNAEAFAEIVTVDAKMRAHFKYIEATAGTAEPFLITGESGVGKELFARAIHRISGRSGELVAVNVAGLDESTFADTLFGHTKGAFTGAHEARKGLTEQARNGTLFLDEIGDLAPSSQVKLLRLLQEREYLPVGSDAPRKTNARIIVATNQDLVSLQNEGRFRRDLFYRLRTHHVHVPPLRERKEDLRVLLDHFLELASVELGKKKPSVPDELFTLLRNRDFPGNARELKAMVFDAVSRHDRGVLSMATFRQPLQTGEFVIARDFGDNLADAVRFGTKLPTLKECSTLLVDEALRRADGNQGIAAALLGITRQALNHRLKNRG